jgi:parvulin-like peptidyl-prolyl isomerase
MALIVNGEKIDDSVIQREFERLRPDYERVFKDQPKEDNEQQLLEWSRENVIERVLINQYAKKHGQAMPQEQIEAAFEKMKKQYQDLGQSTEKLTADQEKKIKQEIELQLKAEQILHDVCKNITDPSDEEARKFYNENKERFRTDEQVRVAHIVKHIDFQTNEAAALEAIKDIQQRLKKGESFEVTAGKFSDCPDNGGDLGYIKKGQMVEEFEDVAFNLNIGQVSDIFRTRFGFHIAKLYDRKPSKTPGLEEVKSLIINELREKTKTQAIDDFVDHLRNKAKIEGAS